MKKKILLLTIMLLACMGVQAADWQSVYTNIPGLDLAVDMDTVKSINDDEYLYAIKYSVANKPEQVAYIKSNSKTNYVGIIQSGDYDIEKYKPKAVFAEPRVFMKPINEDSFLKYAHQYAIAATKGNTVANAFSPSEYEVVYTSQDKPILRDDLMVSYKNTNTTYTNPEFRDYLVRTCKLLEQNWTPPATGRDTRAIVLVWIGADGSLLNYSFAEVSGDNVTDRSIISALEKTVPYPNFPETVQKASALDFQFVFEHDLLKKSVVY